MWREMSEWVGRIFVGLLSLAIFLVLAIFSIWTTICIFVIIFHVFRLAFPFIIVVVFVAMLVDAVYERRGY